MSAGYPDRIHAEQRIGLSDVEIAIIPVDTGSVSAVWCFERREVAGTEALPSDAGLLLSRSGAQQLMDELWRLRVRPTDYRDTRGEVSARDRHIADLLMIAKHALGIIE